MIDDNSHQQQHPPPTNRSHQTFHTISNHELGHLNENSQQELQQQEETSARSHVEVTLTQGRPCNDTHNLVEEETWPRGLTSTTNRPQIGQTQQQQQQQSGLSLGNDLVLPLIRTTDSHATNHDHTDAENSNSPRRTNPSQSILFPKASVQASHNAGDTRSQQQMITSQPIQRFLHCLTGPLNIVGRSSKQQQQQQQVDDHADVDLPSNDTDENKRRKIDHPETSALGDLGLVSKADFVPVTAAATASCTRLNIKRPTSFLLTTEDGFAAQNNHNNMTEMMIVTADAIRTAGTESLQRSVHFEDEPSETKDGANNIQARRQDGLGENIRVNLNKVDAYLQKLAPTASPLSQSSIQNKKQNHPDSIPFLVNEIRALVDYVRSKPTLHDSSASFIRDYLRTMLVKMSVQVNGYYLEMEKLAIMAENNDESQSCFKNLPDELCKHVFSCLDGITLAQTRLVCKKWNIFVCDESLWKRLCLERWRSLETDPAVWPLIDFNVNHTDPDKWRRIYPSVFRGKQWRCRLQKTGRFICQLVAHHISGASLGDQGIPYTLIVERRFNILHLQNFVLPEASLLYFEPEMEEDRAGFEDFIDYLTQRTRAGLALEDQRRFIFIPPCEFTENLNYTGSSLLGIVQNAYPPLAP